LEAGNSVAPPGQMAKMAEIAEGQRRRVRYLRVPDAGHLIHDDAPQIYRREVSDFLRAL
jgi:pimeloyl-ACP methyl ester carboxylesterase